MNTGTAMLIRCRDWIRHRPLFFRTVVFTLLFLAPYFLLALLLGIDQPARVFRTFAIVYGIGLVVFYLSGRYNLRRTARAERRRR